MDTSDGETTDVTDQTDALYCCIALYLTNNGEATNNLTHNMVRLLSSSHKIPSMDENEGFLDGDVPIFEASSGLLDEGALDDHATAIDNINNGKVITDKNVAKHRYNQSAP